MSCFVPRNIFAAVVELKPLHFLNLVNLCFPDRITRLLFIKKTVNRKIMPKSVFGIDV